MDFLKSWLTNLVIFILLAMVFDLLMPTKTFKKYTKLVVGLLFVSILITPVTKIFQIDFSQILEEQLNNFGKRKNEVFVQKIEKQKKEIIASDRAYILEQMAVQLKNIVYKEMIDKFDYEIINIKIKLKDASKEFSADNISVIYITLQKLEVSQVEEIKVEIGQNKPETSKEALQINRWLEKQWGFSKNTCKVVIK